MNGAVEVGGKSMIVCSYIHDFICELNPQGGVVFNDRGDVNITNSTFKNNTATVSWRPRIREAMGSSDIFLTPTCALCVNRLVRLCVYAPYFTTNEFGAKRLATAITH